MLSLNLPNSSFDIHRFFLHGSRNDVEMSFKTTSIIMNEVYQ